MVRSAMGQPFVGLQLSPLYKRCLYWIMSIASFGVLPLLSLSFPSVYIYFFFRRCPVHRSSFVLISGRHVRPVVSISVPDAGMDGHGGFSRLDVIKVARFRGQRFVFDDAAGTFVDPYDMISQAQVVGTNPEIGMNYGEHGRRLILFGSNATIGLDDMLLASRRGSVWLSYRVRKGWVLLVKELSHPFYIFQWFAVVVWLWRTFVAYAFLLFCVSVTCFYICYKQSKNHLKTVEAIAKSQQVEISVRRGGKTSAAGSSGLVPGDIIEFSGRLTVPCDCLILAGSVSVDESALNGDPTVKRRQAGDVLLAGYSISSVGFDTSVGRHSATAVVTHTGFSTVRGALVRRALIGDNQPAALSSGASDRISRFGFQQAERHLNGFWKVTLTWAAFFWVCAIILFLYSVQQVVTLSERVMFSFVQASLAVPSILLASFCITVSATVARLRKKQIFCIDPASTVLFGSVGMLIFDKTGTLTSSSSLKLHAAQPAIRRPGDENASFSPVISSRMDMPEDILLVMAACHSLDVRLTPVLVDRKSTAFPRPDQPRTRYVIVGDPLDKELFQFSGSSISLITPSLPSLASSSNSLASLLTSLPEAESLSKFCIAVHPTRNVSVEGVLAFDSQNRFNASLVRIEDRELQQTDTRETRVSYRLLVKGSPEAVLARCTASSVPPNWRLSLESWALQGYRVIASGMKVISKPAAPGVDVSPDLVAGIQFLGFLIFENELQPDSVAVVKHLMRSRIRTVLVSGDSPMTTIAVGRKAGIIYPQCPVLLGTVAHVESKETDQLATDNKESDNDHAALRGVSVDWIPVGVAAEDSSLQFGRPASAEALLPYEELALTGETLELLDRTVDRRQRWFFHRLLCRTRIFCYMQPHHKELLVRLFQDEMQCRVGYVGDGPNDVLAMAHASASVALLDGSATGSRKGASASVVGCCTPFLTDPDNVGSVLRLIREGRATLSNLFHSFKFMLLSSFIIFLSMSLLYREGISGFSQAQLIWLQFFEAYPLSLLLCLSGSFERIMNVNVTHSVLSRHFLLGFLGHLTICTFFSCLMLYWASRSNWYDELSASSFQTNNVQSVANTVLFLFSSWQLLIAAGVMSISKPFRQPLYRNAPFLGYMTWLLFGNLYVSFVGDSNIESLFSLDFASDSGVTNLNAIPPHFRRTLAIALGLHVICSLLYEYIVISFTVFKASTLLEGTPEGEQIRRETLLRMAAGGNYDFSAVDSTLSLAPHRELLEKEKPMKFLPAGRRKGAGF